MSSSVVCLLYIDVVRLKNETTAQCDCAKEYNRNKKTELHEKNDSQIYGQTL